MKKNFCNLSEYRHAQFSYVFRRLQYAKQSVRKKKKMIRIAEGKKAQRAIEELLRQEDPKSIDRGGDYKRIFN